MKYFLFLRSTAALLGSVLARPDPGGMAYCIGEGAAAETGEGAGGGAAGGATLSGAEVAGAVAGSGSGRGKICFNRLFL